MMATLMMMARAMRCNGEVVVFDDAGADDHVYDACKDASCEGDDEYG